MSRERQRIQEAYRDRERQNLLYREDNPAFVFHMEERRRTLLQLYRVAGLDPGKHSQLEVGCGTGHLMETWDRAFGVDLMGDRLRQGKADQPRLHLACSDGACLPFADGQFDLVSQYMCLSSILDGRVRARVAKEMLRVLKPGGILLSYDMRPKPWPGPALDRWLRRRHERKSGIRTVEAPTETLPLGWDDLQVLFAPLKLKGVSTSLEFGWAYLAKYSTALARLAAWFPFMRSHWLVWGRKPC